jgi:hypothetical protein
MFKIPLSVSSILVNKFRGIFRDFANRSVYCRELFIVILDCKMGTLSQECLQIETIHPILPEAGGLGLRIKGKKKSGELNYEFLLVLNFRIRSQPNTTSYCWR